MSEYIIQLKGICKAYDGKNVVKNIDLNIKKGEFVTILGPSGCGKTTTLRMIAGFEQPTEGQILFDGKDIAGLPPYKRRVNTVFQKYALFPHLNVFGNIAFGLKLKKVEVSVLDKTGAVLPNKKEINLKDTLVDQIIYDSNKEPVIDPITNTPKTKTVKYKNQYKYVKTTNKNGVIKYKKVNQYKAFITDKVTKALKIVGLSDYETRNVNSLSGGQQQRVAIARAIVNEPQILLLDEPLGALDLKMRQEMQLELKAMHDKLGITFVYVTHDQEEALTMSDTIIVMRDGSIFQEGSPMDIYNEPANAYVADFIGESNILDGIMLQDELAKFCGVQFPCLDKDFDKNEPVDVVIRPEDIDVKKPGKGMIEGKIQSSMFRGVHYEMSCIANGYEFTIHSTKEYVAGTDVSLEIVPDSIHIMHKETRKNTVSVTFDSENTMSFYDATYTFNPVNFFGENVDPQTYIGKKALVSFEFTQVDMTDSENDAPLAGNVESMIYKGKNYLVAIKTDGGHHILADTEYLWNDGDRVGIKVEPDDFSFIKLLEDE